ncbi:MAG TPA: response regulator [Gemmatimonadales bacterium]|nr:response regulator [Gemmatimonadales bacterium]
MSDVPDPTPRSVPVPSSLLLVDDCADDRILFRRALRRIDLSPPIEEATDGEEAIALLRSRLAGPPSELPALMLLDLKMPRRSGFEVLEWRRTVPLIRRVPCIVLSSSAEHSDVQRALELGANSYLRKPVTMEELVWLVRAAMIYWLGFNTFAPRLHPGPGHAPVRH